MLLATPVPSSVFDIIQMKKWSLLKAKLMDTCFKIAFTPYSEEKSKWYSFMFSWGGYMRGHMLRMPLRLLIPHLLKKGYIRLTVKDENKTENLIP